MTTIETEVLRRTPILGWIVGVFSRNQMFPVAAGLFLNIVLMLLFCLGWWWLGNLTDENAVYQEHYKYSIFAVQAAFLGGIISLILRLPSAGAFQDQSVVIMFLTAFFKPWVALVFGGVVFMLMNSKGLGVQLINQEVLKDPHFWAVVGFASGWSERFTPDIITKAAERVQTGREAPRPGLGEAAKRSRDQTVHEGQTAQAPSPPSPRRDDTATAEGREATDVRRL